MITRSYSYNCKVTDTLKGNHEVSRSTSGNCKVTAILRNNCKVAISINSYQGSY